MATNILSRIVAAKKDAVARDRARVPETALRDQAETVGAHRSFYDALATPGPCGVNIIAEIKRASPSKGTIRGDLEATQYAQAYEAGGAAAISVLTDEPFFKGSPLDLTQARETTRLPVLRKDFIISTYQIYASKVMGADAVLLIVRILDLPQLKEYLQLTHELDMEALVEIHSPTDTEKAMEAGARLVGINNRNLRSFDTDIHRAGRMAALLSPDQVAVAASGIHTREDILTSQQAGLYNFLIGESLVRASDPRAHLEQLLGV